MAVLIRELGPNVVANMKPFSFQQEVSNEELETYLENVMAGSLEECFARIAVTYSPKRMKVEQQLRDLSTQAPLSYLIKKEIMDHRGLVMATVGPLQDDLDGNVVNQMSLNMQILSGILATVIDRSLKKHSVNKEVLLQHLLLSPVFDHEQAPYLTSAMHCYLQGDYAIAIHLLVPQIEATIRNLVERSGGAVFKSRDGGGYLLRTLDELLRTEQSKSVLTDDVTLYFRVVLTDQRGWNIRNRVCHGTFPYESASRVVADRLVHILIVLALLRSA